MKADFWRQTAEPMTNEEKREWFRARAREFGQAGAKAVRASIHPNHPGLLLIEGWRDRFAEQGEPGFALTP